VSEILGIGSSASTENASRNRRLSRIRSLSAIGLILLLGFGAAAKNEPLSDNKDIRDGRCTVNIKIRNSAAIEPTTIDATKAELSRIYGDAGIDISFDRIGNEKASVELWLVSKYPRYIVNELKDLGYLPTEVAGFQSGRYFGSVYVRLGYDSRHTHNGYYIGRVAAHETGHRFLAGWESKEYGESSHAQFGIMSYSGTFFLDAPPDEIPELRDTPPPFSFQPNEAEYLRRCEFAQQSTEGKVKATSVIRKVPAAGKRRKTQARATRESKR
jgi:hypothetical protein